MWVINLNGIRRHRGRLSFKLIHQFAIFRRWIKKRVTKKSKQTNNHTQTIYYAENKISPSKPTLIWIVIVVDKHTRKHRTMERKMKKNRPANVDSCKWHCGVKRMELRCWVLSKVKYGVGLNFQIKAETVNTSNCTQKAFITICTSRCQVWSSFFRRLIL